MASCRLLDPNLSAESCVAHYVQAMKLFKTEKFHEVGYSRESDMRGSTVLSLLSYKCKERRGLVGLKKVWTPTCLQSTHAEAQPLQCVG